MDRRFNMLLCFVMALATMAITVTAVATVSYQTNGFTSPQFHSVDFILNSRMLEEAPDPLPPSRDVESLLSFRKASKLTQVDLCLTGRLGI